MKIHPNDLFLRDAFGRSDLPADRRRVLLDHLGRCARCRERLRDLLSPLPGLAGKVRERLRGSSGPIDYGAALDRSFRRAETRRVALARERAAAPTLLARLLEQSPKRQELLLRNHPRFQSWALAELLLERSAEKAIESSRESEELARLALRVIERLDTDYYGSARLEDLRARSWARIGNAHRMRSDPSGAERAFAAAAERLRRGTGDPLEKAACLELRSSLLRAQRRLPEATRTQERAISIYLEAGERHSAGRALLNLGITLSISGRPDHGISVLLHAFTMIEPLREPYLVLVGGHNLVDDLIRTGRLSEAQHMLSQVLPLYDRFPSGSAPSRRQWLEAKLALRLGRPSQARTLFALAQVGLLLDGRYQEAEIITGELRSIPS
jgi:tetratricopeptide (TPR) repeat protein